MSLGKYMCILLSDYIISQGCTQHCLFCINKEIFNVPLIDIKDIQPNITSSQETQRNHLNTL